MSYFVKINYKQPLELSSLDVLELLLIYAEMAIKSILVKAKLLLLLLC